jgi:hypothetical protein
LGQQHQRPVLLLLLRQVQWLWCRRTQPRMAQVWQPQQLEMQQQQV